MSNKSMGEIISTLRRQRGMTQKELADLLNITDKAVSKWERDIAYPDTQTIPKLAKILDISVEDLMNAKLVPVDGQKRSAYLIDITKGAHYAIYLMAMGIVLGMGAVTNVRSVPALSVHINFSNIINFLDIAGLTFILIVCLIALLCTRSVCPLKDAFVYMFIKGEYTADQCESCLLAVKTTMLSAFAAGFIMFLISVVNVLKSMDLSGGVSMLGVDLSKGLITPIYSLVIAFILLPVYVELKRGLSQTADSKQEIAARAKNKKAG